MNWPESIRSTRATSGEVGWLGKLECVGWSGVCQVHLSGRLVHLLASAIHAYRGEEATGPLAEFEVQVVLRQSQVA
jgi:hypothetical protein